MSSDFSDFFPSIAAIVIAMCLIILANLFLGLLKGSVKRGHASLFTIYDEEKDKFNFGSIVGTLFLVGILFSLFSPTIAGEFRLNFLATLSFGLFFIFLSFLLILVKIR